MRKYRVIRNVRSARYLLERKRFFFWWLPLSFSGKTTTFDSHQEAYEFLLKVEGRPNIEVLNPEYLYRF